MKKLSLIFTLLVSILFMQSLQAQLNLQLTVRNPTPYDLYQWEQDATIVLLNVTNRTDNEYENVVFGFKITNENGDVLAESKHDSPTARRFTIPPFPQNKILNGADLIDVNSISYNRNVNNTSSLSSRVTSALIPTSIPEGFYEICISAYIRDNNGNYINITENDFYCTSFNILIPEPPALISPIDDETLMMPYPNFIWTPVTSISPSTQIRYKLKICPIFKGQNPRTAIEGNSFLLMKDDIVITSYTYLHSDVPLDTYKDIDGYVWMVQAFDQNGVPASKNQGRSELGVFKLEQKVEPTITLSNTYPVNNDTLPWNMPHLVSKFTPYSDDISSVELTLRVRKDGDNEELVNTRTLTFNGGAKASQLLSSDDEASLLIANVDNSGAFPLWMQFLERGVKYNWSVEATFTKTDGTSETINSGETSFVLGLKKLKKVFPSKDSLIVKGRKFDCKFEIAQPEKLNFDKHALLNNSSFHAYNTFSDASAKILIELAKNKSFDTIIQSQNFILSNQNEWKTGNNCKDLFKPTKKLDAPSDTGKYYYRIKYLNNADQPYFTSSIIPLKIIPDSLITCFEMKVERPTNNGTWDKSKKPKFSVSIKPKINKSAITGGHIKVWYKESESISNEDVKKNKPVFDTTFTGNKNNKIFAFSTDLDGFTRYDLNFVNGDSTSTSWEAGKDSTYLWTFQLQYKKDSIRNDKLLCDSTAVTSNDGIFKVTEADTTDSNKCPGNCITELPSDKTPGSQSFGKDTTLTFGKFKLKLNDVSGTASDLSGSGTIEVKYLRAPIIVEFNGLKVNKDNEVYEGEAFAKIDEAVEYTKSNAEGYEGKALNFVEGVGKFKEIHDYSVSSGKLVSSLVGTNPVTLPIGFDRDYSGYKVIIGIVGMTFTPVKGTLDAAMYVEFPSLGTDVGLGFGAKDICFHKDGIAGKEKGMLYLAQDFGYENEGTWSMKFKAPTPADSGTYALWDCKGFNELLIAAEVEFPRSWMKPTPDPDPTKLVKAHFTTRANKFGNGWEWIATANLDHCELSGAEGYKMQVQEMVFDYSKAKNPEGIKFPENYKGKKNNEWTGFYIKRAMVSFPDKIKTFDDVSPILSVNNLLIDKTGITAGIWGENIFKDDVGDFAGMAYTLDSIKINLLSSSLQSGKMKGKLRFNFFDTSLVYSGILAQSSVGKLQYQLRVEVQDSLEVDMWKSKLNLDGTSRIEMLDTAGKFVAQAVLDGKLSLDGDPGGLSKVGFKGIKFEELKVTPKSPWVTCKDFKFASPQHSLAGFPVNITNVGIASESRGSGFGVGLKFNLNIGFQSGSNAFGGTTKLGVWSKIETGQYGTDFSFDGIELDSVGINADLGAVRIAGGLELFDSHHTFGDGFRGVVGATFVDKISVDATAQFGSVNDYRYWYVDAKALFPTAVPIASGIGMYGFGGGAWYHMQIADTTNLSSAASEPDASKNAGTTNSGYRYIPNKNVNLGLKATMIIGTHPSPDAFNGDVGLEADFLSGGGIGTVRLFGKGYMMSSITKRNKAKVKANLDFAYNVPTETFHGTFKVNLNAAPLELNNADMVIHASPSTWFMKLGDPKRVELSLAGLINSQCYFMLGQGLTPPGVPNEISSSFPGQFGQIDGSVATGDGIAFGARTGFETGRKEYMGFYGELNAWAGFDLALLNYTEDASCEGSDSPMGINGWYATGDIYSYVSAEIGMHVDLWFTEGNYKILDLQAAAALSGGGPRPTWLRGMVGGEYRILGGKVKGNCNFHFSIGEECKIEQVNPLSRIDLITDISPSSGAQNVEVMFEPQVATSFRLNKSFELQEMPDGDGEPVIRTFKVKLKDFNLKNTANNDSIPGKINIASDDFSAFYSSHDVLPGYSNLHLEVSAYGEELINGIWHPAVKKDGSLIVQTESTDFRTGPQPDKIEDDNVAYSYPVNRQYYFLQDECNRGIVKLITGQNDLFTVYSNQDVEFIARFIPTDENANPIEVPFQYHSSETAISFNIPTLQNSTEYYLQFIRKTTTEVKNKGKSGMQRHKTTNEEEKELRSNKAGNVTVTYRSLMEDKVRTHEKLLYSMRFNTSMYNTLEAKLNDYKFITTESEFYSNSMEEHRAVYEGEEAFDRRDFETMTWTRSENKYSYGPLVKVVGSERTTPWHTSFTNPEIYDNLNWIKNDIGWDDGMGTEFDFYNSGVSSMHQLVSLKINGYYEPVSTSIEDILTDPKYEELNVGSNASAYATAASTYTNATTSASKATSNAETKATAAKSTTDKANKSTSTKKSSSRSTKATKTGRSSGATKNATKTNDSSTKTKNTRSTSGSKSGWSSQGSAAANTTASGASNAVNMGALTGASSGSGATGLSYSPGGISEANLDQMLDYFTMTPNFIITYKHGIAIPQDFNRLLNKALVISPRTPADLDRKNYILNDIRYTPMFKGEYPLRLYYNYLKCHNVDADLPTFEIPLIY